MRILLPAVTALSLIAATGMAVGITETSFAQSSNATITTETTPPVPPSSREAVTTTVTRTRTKHGVTIDEDTDGTEDISPGTPGTSRTVTHATTIR